jgi:hypothetical protein
MDAILTGTLYYRDLMPDITVNEFLEGLYNKFGLVWYVNSNTKTVRFLFVRDLVDMYASAAVNLNAFKTEEPEITWSPQQQLKLTANREVGKSGSGNTSETLYNTFEEFLRAYNYQFTDVYLEDDYVEGVNCLFAADESQYHIREAIDTVDREYLDSSDFFDWDKKTSNMEYEEIKMDDLCLPFDYFMNIQMLHYGANVKHHYSDVVVEGETPKEEENPAKLAFVFGWGLTDFTASNRYNWFFASQINRDVHGNFMNDPDSVRYDISLTINREDGLYNRFWKNYDAFIRHSNQTVKCNMKLSDAELFRMQMDRQLTVNNQPLIPEQFKFKLNDPKNITEGTFRTLRLYRPCDLDIEQHIPTYENQKYYWKQTSVVKEPVLSYPYNEYSDFGYGFVTIDGVNHDTKMLFILPPTDEQFQNNEQIILTYHSTAMDSVHPDVRLTTTVTYTPTLIIYP